MPAAKGKFKVVVQQPSGGISFDLAEGAYAIEREALDPIGAEIVEDLYPPGVGCEPGYRDEVELEVDTFDRTGEVGHAAHGKALGRYLHGRDGNV